VPDSCKLVSARRSRLTFVDDARVEFHRNGISDNVAQETRRVLALTLREVSVLHLVQRMRILLQCEKSLRREGGTSWRNMEDSIVAKVCHRSTVPRSKSEMHNHVTIEAFWSGLWR
jgi:hypothetical protein